jgi:hypothetical protein
VYYSRGETKEEVEIKKKEMTTKAKNEAVKRHRERFSDDVMFQLADQEVINLKSQSVTSSGITKTIPQEQR